MTTATKSQPPLVYYIRCKDRIKIGTTMQFNTRMSGLSTAEQYPIAVLAVEPGGRELEKSRHEQFAADRIHGEWFTVSGYLMAHIEQLAAVHPIPKWRPLRPSEPMTHWLYADDGCPVKFPLRWIEEPWRRELIRQLLGWKKPSATDDQEP